MVNFIGNCQMVFQSSCTILHSHQQWMRVAVTSDPSQHLVLLSAIFILAILIGYNGISTVTLIRIPAVANDISIFSCVYWSYMYPFSAKCLFKLFAHF